MGGILYTATVIPQQPQERWKNGQGLTRPVAIHPPQARFPQDQLVWRVANAVCDPSYGREIPFSDCPEKDRVMMLMEGPGLTLRHRGHGETRITRLFEAYAWSGDWETTCVLEDNRAVTDLNVMVDRSRARAEMVRYDLSKGPIDVALQAAWHVFYTYFGTVRIRSEGLESVYSISTDQALRLDQQAGTDEKVTLSLTPEASGTVLLGVNIFLATQISEGR